jgi:hypothetical protein
MTELPEGAKALLALTKDAHDPHDADAQRRVRERVALSLGLAAAGATLGAAAAASAQGVARKALLSSLAGKLALGASALAFVGVSSVYVAQREPAERVHERAPAVQTLPAERPPTDTGDSALPKGPAQARAAEPVIARSATPRPAKAVSAAKRQRARAARPAPESLSQEVSLLDEAERSLGAGDVQRALALLSEHRARFPRAALREEREGLSVLARCVQARAGAREQETAAREAARAFLARHPRSLLRARLEQACIPGAAP